MFYFYLMTVLDHRVNRPLPNRKIDSKNKENKPSNKD